MKMLPGIYALDEDAEPAFVKVAMNIRVPYKVKIFWTSLR